jgi:hypothetical protein
VGARGRQPTSTATQAWVLALTAVASFMVSLDSLVVATALSTIRLHFGASLEALEWTVNAYTLSFAVLLMTGAALADRFGRRRLFTAGLALFVAASAACALAPGVGWLIAARAVQGVGAALVMPLAMALLSAAFPPERRARALGIFSGVTGLAVLGGPVIGGAIAQGSAWQWIFWLNVPIGLLAYTPFAAAMIVAGAGVSMAMPATQNAVVGSVARSELGKASGTLNMLRFLGGAFGVAILGAVFAGTGSYGSAQAFSDGFAPAIGVAAALSLMGALAGIGLPGRRQVTESAPTQPDALPPLVKGGS